MDSMKQLDKYNQEPAPRKPARTRNQPEWGVRKQYDRDSCPAGWDRDIWDLVLFWEQKRDQYSHTGPGRPVIYAELKAVIGKSILTHVESQAFGSWMDLARAMIERFWDDEEEAAGDKARYALDTFCQKGYFTELMNWMIDKAEHERFMSTATGKKAPYKVVNGRRTRRGL